MSTSSPLLFVLTEMSSIWIVFYNPVVPFHLRWPRLWNPLKVPTEPTAQHSGSVQLRWWYSNSPLIELLLLPKLFGDAFVTHFNTISIRRSSRSKFDYSRIYTRVCVCLLLFPFHVDAHIQNRLSRCPSLGPAVLFPVASAVIQKRWKVNALLRLSFQGVNSYPPAGRISSRYMLNPTLFLQLLFFYSFVLIIYKQGDHTHVVLTLAAQRWSLSLDPSLSIRHLLSLSFVLGSSSSITTDGEKRNAREPLPFYRPFQLHPTTPTFCVQDPLLHS